MKLFQLIIDPFIFIIERIFLFSFQITGNYGWSIVLLSFGISLLLLPIFIYIEKAKRKDDALKLKMKPLADEIKRVYKGQERFYYLKTLNRQFNYSPFRALIPILTLLVQIPFFIAAYLYLENLEALKGVSFLFIPDLSQPDGLLGSINILPIAMTVVNLVTAWFYTRHGDKKERWQMVVVAGVFLIMLFNLPSGLVLYWTMNNVFSFFRLFVTNPEVFKKGETIKKEKNSLPIKTFWLNIKPKLIVAFIILLVLAIYSQVNWALQNSFVDFQWRIIGAFLGSIIIIALTFLILLIVKKYKNQLLGIRVKPILFYPGVFLTIYFYFSGTFYFGQHNNELFLISLSLLALVQVTSAIYIFKNAQQIPNVLHRINSAVLLFIFIIQSFNAIALISGSPILLNLFNTDISVKNSEIADILHSGFIFLMLALPYYLKSHPLIVHKPNSSNRLLFILTAFYLAGYIFIWNPLIIFSSSPETFEFQAIQIIKNNLSLFLMVLAISIAPYFIMNKKLKKLYLLLFLLIAIVGFFNSTIFPLKLGSLQVSRFSEQKNLAAPLFRYLFEGGLIIGLAIVLKQLFIKNRQKVLVWIMAGLIIITAFQSFYLSINTGKFFSGKNTSAQTSKELKPISFSKHNQNILFFIPDGFQGWFIGKIFEEEPELKKAFEGFTWYPNTVSMSNYTHSSIPSMLGGYQYSVPEMNKDKSKTIETKRNIAAKNFFKKVKTDQFYISAEKIHYAQFDEPIIDNYFPTWNKKWRTYQNQVKLGAFEDVWFKRLYENAIFNIAPLAFKPTIYNNQKWLSAFKKEKISNYTFSWYNFLRLLPYLSNAESKNKNFIYIHSAAAHLPYNIVTDNGRPKLNVTPYENNKWVLKQLARWISWMKENGVYDNTKIILVSDHGPSWYEYDGTTEFDSPFIQGSSEIDKRFYWRLNPLLMIKDFNNQGQLMVVDSLMCNADASYLTFNQPIPRQYENGKRVLTTYWTKWVSKMTQQDTMQIYKQYEVKENVYDLNNWIEVKNSQ